MPDDDTMLAWELDDGRGRPGRPGPAVRGVPERPGPLGRAVRAGGRRHGPPVAARRGRAVLRRVGPGAGHRRRAPRARSCRVRWSSWRRPSRTGSTTSRSGSSSSWSSARPRARAADPAQRASRSTAACEGRGQLRTAADLVVAEEHVGIVPGREERLDAVRPGVEFRRRSSRGGGAAGTGAGRSAGCRRRLVVRLLRGAQGRAGLGQGLRTSRRRASSESGNSIVSGDVARPGRQRRDQAAVVDPLARDVQEHRPEPLPEPPIRIGQPGHALARIARHRPEGPAALRLDREPERVGRRRQPQVDLVRPWVTGSRCCSARRHRGRAA